MSSVARVEAMAVEIENAFAYDKNLARVVARSNLITFYNQAVEDAARAVERALPHSDGVLARTVVRALLIAD